MELAAGAGRWLGWLVGAGEPEPDLPAFDDAKLAPFNTNDTLYVALDGAGASSRLPSTTFSAALSPARRLCAQLNQPAYAGVVYDVTSREDLYGVGNSYNRLAGRDATRSLATMELSQVDLPARSRSVSPPRLLRPPPAHTHTHTHKTLQPLPNPSTIAAHPLVVCGRAEMHADDVETLDEWVEKYRKKYPAVGRYVRGETTAPLPEPAAEPKMETEVQTVEIAPGVWMPRPNTSKQVAAGLLASSHFVLSLSVSLARGASCQNGCKTMPSWLPYQS